MSLLCYGLIKIDLEMNYLMFHLKNVQFDPPTSCFDCCLLSIDLSAKISLHIAYRLGWRGGGGNKRILGAHPRTQV